MEGYFPVKLKRKDLDEVNDNFCDFSLSSPARKIRRLCRVPLQQQQLLCNGKKMRNAETLSRLGVTDGDLVTMVPSPSSPSSNSMQRGLRDR